MIILQLIAHCPRSWRVELAPALNLAGTYAEATRATHGYTRSVTVPLSASMLNGQTNP